MAEQGWTTQVATAAGVAAGAGAAQLGIGYGLGVVVWPTTPLFGDVEWLGNLVWAVWIAAGSTVLGSVAALRRGTGTSGAAPGAVARLTLVFAAAVGALLTIALVALPARAAVRPGTYSPQCIAAGYTALGVLLGMVIAWWAITSRSVAANVLATSAWLWNLAVVAIVTSLRTTGPDTGVQLGHWRMTAVGNGYFYGTVYWPAALLAVAGALLIGILAAWPAARRGETGLGVAASGAVGPLLVAAAYFTVAPQLTGARGLLESAYLISPYTVLAGLAGSALVVALGQKAQNRLTVRRAPASRSAESAAPARSVEPAAAPPSPEPTPPRRRGRSTVKAPPAKPTVATINPPRPTPAKNAAKPAGTAARKSARPAKAAAVPAFSENAGTDPAPVAAGPHAKTPKAAPAESPQPDSTAVGPTDRPPAGLADSVPLWVDDGAASDSDRDGIKNRLRRFGRRSGEDSP